MRFPPKLSSAINKALLLGLVSGSLVALSFPVLAQQASSPSSSSKIIGDAYWSTAGSSNKAGAVVGPDGVLANSVLQHKTSVSKVSLARSQTIEQAALTYGTQAGLAWKTQAITNTLTAHTAEYNKIFNFASVELKPGFLPPVISEGKDLYNQTNDSTVREAEVLYKIEQPARLVNVPPRWQDYLTMGVIAPDFPDQTVLPQNDAEKQLWDIWAKKGWEAGIQQAKGVFENNVGRLRRDYLGMLRFKKLYQLNLVSMPVLAQANLGITGGNNEMAVGDRVIRITLPSKFNPDSATWESSPPAPSIVLPEDLPQGSNVNQNQP